MSEQNSILQLQERKPKAEYHFYIIQNVGIY